MSDTTLRPVTEAELAEIVVSTDHLLAVGNRSKPALSDHAGATLVSTALLSGVTEYEPSEFTFTAKAGTRIDEIASVLGQRNQYLPFDPMLTGSGATLGGTVASGLSGPGRFRFGGVRDFLLGVDFFSGEGTPIRSGGKVVKNAAGFDIPKLLVGSLGRLGVMTSFTFKVFPRAIATLTLSVACDSLEQATQRTAEAAASRWELDAIDYRYSPKTLFLRLAGPDEVNRAIASEVRERWGDDVSDVADSDGFWRDVNELSWCPENSIMVKVPITPNSFLAFAKTIAGDTDVQMHLSGATNVMWVAVADLKPLDECLRACKLSGLVVRGESSKCRIGNLESSKMAMAIKRAMDPENRFPALD